MASDDNQAASPGFFSSLMGGIGGLLGYKDDPNAQQKGETAADYATRRQEARFAVMKQEVDGLLKKYSPTEDLPKEAFSDERRGLRQRGFDQKEEDAIIHTFAITHGERRGNLDLGPSSGKEEWEAPEGSPAKGGGPEQYKEEPDNAQAADIMNLFAQRFGQNAPSGNRMPAPALKEIAKTIKGGRLLGGDRI